MASAVRICLLAVAVPSALMAAEQRVEDLALAVEVRPTAVSVRWDDRLGSARADGDLSSAWAAGPRLRWGWSEPGRPHLVVVGVEALWLREGWDEATIQGPELRAETGYGYALANQWLFTALVGVGIGRLALDRPSPLSGGLSMDGTLVEGGARLGLRWSADGHWSAQADAGWLAGRQSFSGDGASLRLDHAGPWFALAAVWTIDPQPRPLR